MAGMAWIGLAGEDHHPGDAALFALHQQLDQVGFIPGWLMPVINTSSPPMIHSAICSFSAT